MAALAVRRRRLLWKPRTRSLLGAYINSVITTHKIISAPKPAKMQLQPTSMRAVERQSGREYTAQRKCIHLFCLPKELCSLMPDSEPLQHLQSSLAYLKASRR